jgi:hypothetical protein
MILCVQVYFKLFVARQRNMLCLLGIFIDLRCVLGSVASVASVSLIYSLDCRVFMILRTISLNNYGKSLHRLDSRLAGWFGLVDEVI